MLWLIVILSITTDHLEGLFSVGDYYLSPMRILILVLSAYVASQYALRTRCTSAQTGPVMRGFLLPMSICLALVVASVFFSADRWYSTKRALHLVSLFVLACATYYLSGWQRWRAQSVMNAWLAAGITVCVVGVLQAGLGLFYGAPDSGTRPLLGFNVTRVNSLFSDPNFFGFFLLSFVPLAVLRSAKGPARGGKALLVALGLLCVVLTASRGTMLALLGATTLAFAFGARLASRFRAGLVIVLSIAFAWGYYVATSETFMAKLGDLDNSGEGSMRSRAYIWQAGFRLIEDHPWLGVGPGNFVKVDKGRYLDGFTEDQQEIYSSIAGHSNYVEIAAESGVAALLAYLAAFSYVLRSVLLRRRLGSEPDRQAFRWMALSLGGWLLANAFLSYYPFFAFVMIGFALRLCERYPGVSQ
jgi:O-antigen ligase